MNGGFTFARHTAENDVIINGEEMMGVDVLSRLKELGIYSDYYYRIELKVLGQLLNMDEKLNSVLTGVVDGKRRMVAVTDFRILIISAGVVSQSDIKIIKRTAVKSWQFTKKFLLSSVSIITEQGEILIKQTQAKQEKLFTWAMNQEIKEYDE